MGVSFYFLTQKTYVVIIFIKICISGSERMVYKLSCSDAGRNYVHNYKAWHTEIRAPLNSTLCDVKPAEVNPISIYLPLRLGNWVKWVFFYFRQKKIAGVYNLQVLVSVLIMCHVDFDTTFIST